MSSRRSEREHENRRLSRRRRGRARVDGCGDARPRARVQAPPARARRSPPPVRGGGGDPLRPSVAGLHEGRLPRCRRHPGRLAARAGARRREGRPASRVARRPRPAARRRRHRRRRAGRGVGERHRDVTRVLVRRLAARPHHVRGRLGRVARCRADAGQSLGRPRRRAGRARRRARAPARRAGLARRDRHREPSRSRHGRRRGPLRRLAVVRRARVAARQGTRRVRAGHLGARRRGRLRHGRPRGNAADGVADARRGAEAPLRVAHARAGGGRGRPPGQPARHALVHGRRDRAAAADPHRRRALRRGGVMARMLGSDALLRALEHEGVDVAFGIPGGAIPPTCAASARGTTVRHVLARHEQGAGHMAEGYARASGKVGVAIATSGPGATNLVTPIADAWMDSTPLVCITGQVRSDLIGTDAFQEIDATGITMPIVKHSWLVQDVKELPGILKAAFHVARTGRQGPVLVDVAKDVQEAELEFRYPDEVDLPGWKPPRTVHLRQIREAAKAIAEAQRPIVYAGGGVLNADACDELLQLVDSAQLPAVVTLMGKGCLPDSHRLNYGAPGMHGSKYANWALNKADLVIAVGARFDDRVTGKLAAFAPGAKVIHFDIDAAEVGKIREADIPVVGPLKEALARLAATLEHGDHEPWVRQLDDWRAQFPYRYTREPGTLKPQTVVETLRDLTAGREDVIWTTGVGQHQMWAMQYLVCDRPRSFVTSGGLGTMGYGVPAAIGAKAARPDATVVCIDGDGCFQMTSQELATAALERLPIVVVIVNNGWLGMVRQWQELFYDERYSQTHLTHQVPDYAAPAEALGCAGFMVDSEDDLESTLQAALDSGRTAVVDARVDPNENCYPMVPAGAASVDVLEMPDEEFEHERTAG